MRILITQDTDWINNNPHQQHHVAERLSKRGHNIRVIDYEIRWKTSKYRKIISRRKSFNNVSKIFKNTKIKVIRPSILKIPLLDYFSMIFSYYKEINNQIIKFNPDVIIGHSIISNYLSMILSKIRKIPFIFHMTDTQHKIIPFNFLKPLGKILEKIILKNASCVITINEVLKEYAIKMGANSKKTKVIKAGIEIERYNPEIKTDDIRKKYQIKNKDKVLFFMGYLYHFSGLKEVAKELSNLENDDIKLLIIGDGEAYDNLKNIIKSFNLQKKIILTGKQPYSEIPKLIATSDICILPAYRNDIMENIVPIKMYEYMAMKKPVISTKLPGIMKEFKINNGVIYVDKSEDILNEAKRLINNNLIKKLGERARKFVEDRNWENVIDQFENTLIKIIHCR